MITGRARACPRRMVTCKLTAGASPRPTRLELILREILRADEGICPYKFAKNYSCLVGDGAHTVTQNRSNLAYTIKYLVSLHGSTNFDRLYIILYY